ncbi:MAG: hypothetical protein Tsb0015_11110 [Simkaniaceae bacterium]
MLLLLIIILGGYLVYHKAPKLLEKKLSHKLGVPVTIENMHFFPKSFEITGITIGNPPQSALPTAFKAATVRFEAPYWNYIHPHIVINKVEINDVYVGIEFYDKNNTRGNWTQIISNLDASNGTGQKNDSPAGKTQAAQKTPVKERTALIKHLIVTNIHIDLLLQGDRLRRLSPIEKVEFTNITSEKGLPMDEITELIVQKLMEQISILGGFGNMLKSVLFLPKEAAEVFFSPFQMLFGKPKRQTSPPHQN